MPRAKKALGQNFLVDPNLQRKIVDALDPQPGDTIIEIGPGTGALTRHLVERAGRVVAIEKDDALAAALRDELRDRPGFELIHADALTVPLASLARNGDTVKVVGNIPYNITTPLVFHLLDRPVYADRIVLMVQREVADRMVAEPGDRAFGALTVGVRTAADVERLFHVGRAAFRPVPNVDSTVIRLRPHRPRRLDEREEIDVRTLTRVAFSRRRKQLQKILRSAPEYALESDAAERILRSLDIAPDARPETLGPDTFVALARALRDADLPASVAAEDGAIRPGEELDDHVRAFIGLVGHELRSPVAAILGYSELMADGLYGVVDDRAREGVRRMAAAARQLRALIEGMELVVGQGHPGLDPIDGIDLRTVVHEATEEAGIEAVLRGASLDLHFDDAIPALRTDPDALARALGLVFGAILKASPRGVVRVEAGPTDEGIHISFEGDFELAADPIGTPETIHSGIALRIAMAARSIDALGGDLERSSRDGRTRLRITLPAT